MGALTIANVRKTFGNVEILKGIDIDVQAGEFPVSYTHLTLPTIYSV